jgi:F-box protein 20
LRVEQLLLQIEQQELKRQRENLIIRKNLARREFDEGVKLLMSNDNSSGSLNDVSNTNMTVGNVNSSPYYENVQMRLHHDHINYHNQTPNYTKNDYRKSMPNLQEFAANNWQHESSSSNNYLHQSNNQLYQQYPDDMNALSKSEMYLNSNLVPKPYQPATPTHHHHPINSQNQIYGNMTRQALMQISAVPKPKLTNDWVQYRKSEPMKPSLNSHWLIQEAEQRRIEQMNQMRTGNYVAGGGNCSNSKKPLPDAVIQTLQQRVQNSGLGVNVNKR